MVHISVIIPTYNRLEALQKTLNGLAAQTVPADQFEVILVDDGSSDDVAILLEGMTLPFTSALLQQDNQGPGAARNRGAELAAGDLLVFLDADMIPAKNLIQQYQEAYIAQSDTILIGRQLPWLPAYHSRFEQVFNYVIECNLGEEPLQPEYYHLASGNFAIPKAEFIELGGFDERLLMTEDTDLGYRAHLSNIHICYVPGALGYHNHSKTFRQLCRNIEASAWWTAQLLKKYPGMLGSIPAYRDLEPIDLVSDSLKFIMRKAARRILAFHGFVVLQETMVKSLEHIVTSRKVLLFFYWKILASYRFRGLHEGLRSNG